MKRKTIAILALSVSAACSGDTRDMNSLLPTSPSPAPADAPADTSAEISTVSVTAVGTTAATITWTTDAPSDSAVEYGPTTHYGSVLDGPASVTTHVVVLNQLAQGTGYHFRVRSKDGRGTVATSGNHSFTTLRQDSSPAPGNSGSDDASRGAGTTIAFTAPAKDAVLSETVTLSAAVTGPRVAGVQFSVDGRSVAAEDTQAPYSVRWNSATVADGRHTVTATVRNTAGQTTVSASVRVTVKNAPPSAGGGGGGSTGPDPAPGPAPGPTPPPAPPTGGSNSRWPGEPDGFRVLSDQAWNALTGSGWNYRRRQSSKNADIVSDSSAPGSPSSVLRIIFTPDMARDSEPGVNWTGLPSRPREIFTGWWMKLSPNWQASPAGGGKITFLWATGGQGQVYANIGGSSGPHRININTEWGPYGQKFWEPNVTTTRVNYNQWYRVEWYVRWESRPGAGDGIMRWWVNGALNGDYRNVRFPDQAGFEQFEFAPTLQNAPPAEQYMYIDHTYVSAK